MSSIPTPQRHSELRSEGNGTSGYAVKAIEEMEALHHGAVKLAGAELGVESFGMQLLDLPAGFTEYPEHDHAEDGQEEVYVVLRGTGEFAVDGQRIPIDAGCMLRIGPTSSRKLFPGPEGIKVLAIGGTPGAAYERPEHFRLSVQS